MIHAKKKKEKTKDPNLKLILVTAMDSEKIFPRSQI